MCCGAGPQWRPVLARSDRAAETDGRIRGEQRLEQRPILGIKCGCIGRDDIEHRDPIGLLGYLSRKFLDVHGPTIADFQASARSFARRLP